MLRFFSNLSLSVLVFGFFGCSTPLSERHEYLTSYQQGGLSDADAKLTASISKAMPNFDYRKSNDAVWLLLDRATTRFAMGKVDGAISDYRTAVEAIDFYGQELVSDSIGKVVLDDDYGAYPGEDYEQILARVYFALALLHKGDEGNAFALLRQAEELQQKKKEMYAQSPVTKDYELIDNSVAKVLFASLLEHRGDRSNANILYQKTSDLIGVNQQQENNDLASDILKVTPPENATVLIVCHNGNSPIKISGTSDASVASALALEIILSANRIDPAWSSLTGIPVPALYQNWGSSPAPTFATIDGLQKPLIPWYDIGETADQQLQQKMPVIVARGVARFLLRRGTVAYAKESDPALGVLCDLGMLVANACTKADTRSWTTLPEAIDLNKFNLLPGEHDMAIRVATTGQQPFLGNYRLNLKDGDLCVINVFNIHPGVTTVLIPQRFMQPCVVE